MWIETDRDQLVSLKDAQMEEKVSFSDNNKAQVSKEVGEYLIEAYPSISAVDSEADDEGDDVDDIEAEAAAVVDSEADYSE